MDGGERRMDESSLSDSEEHPRRGDEVAVEDLDEREKGGEQDQPRDRPRRKRALEGGLRSEVLRHERLPRKDDRDREHDGDVEERADDRSRENRASEVAWIEAGPRLLRALPDRLEAGHEVRHDLEDEKDREGRARRSRVREERGEIRGVA